MGCKSCGRKLTAAKSIERGRGERCHKLYLLAKAGFSAKQVEDARDLITDGGIQRSLRRRNLFTVVSSDGETTYLAARQGCTCPAGRKQRPCLHRAAIALIAA